MEVFVEEPFVTTSYAKTSGILGSPMMSGPGKETCSHYLCFKENINRSREFDDKDETDMTEEEKRKQVMFDLNAKNFDVKKQKIMD